MSAEGHTVAAKIGDDGRRYMLIRWGRTDSDDYGVLYAERKDPTTHRALTGVYSQPKDEALELWAQAGNTVRAPKNDADYPVV